MADSGISLEVSGMMETRAEMERIATDLHGPVVVGAMKDATLVVLRDARENAPVDSGKLKNSITAAVQVNADKVVQGVVGSKVTYAPYMELGTKAHWPPIAALETWARRHNISAFLVARSIARKGLVPRKFLQGAFQKNKATIKKIIGSAVTGVIKKR